VHSCRAESVVRNDQEYEHRDEHDAADDPPDRYSVSCRTLKSALLVVLDRVRGPAVTRGHEIRMAMERMPADRRGLTEW
jgi:hypothetical protein